MTRAARPAAGSFDSDSCTRTSMNRHSVLCYRDSSASSIGEIPSPDGLPATHSGQWIRLHLSVYLASLIDARPSEPLPLRRKPGCPSPRPAVQITQRFPSITQRFPSLCEEGREPWRKTPCMRQGLAFYVGRHGRYSCWLAPIEAPVAGHPVSRLSARNDHGWRLPGRALPLCKISPVAAAPVIRTSSCPF